MEQGRNSKVESNSPKCSRDPVSIQITFRLLSQVLEAHDAKKSTCGYQTPKSSFEYRIVKVIRQEEQYLHSFRLST
jgi:hypothetical protein